MKTRFVVPLICVILLSGCMGIFDLDDELAESSTETTTKSSFVDENTSYIYEGLGVGSDFVITLGTDDMFEYTEGSLSSHIGSGYYDVKDGILTLTDVVSVDIKRFKFNINDEKTELRFIADASDVFASMPELEDGALFATYIQHDKESYDGQIVDENALSTIIDVLSSLSYYPDGCREECEYTFMADDGTTYNLNLTKKFAYRNGNGRADISAAVADRLRILISSSPLFDFNISIGDQLRIFVDGELYISTNAEHFIENRSEVPDGYILSSVDIDEYPTENNQSNFGDGYAYQRISDDIVDVLIPNPLGKGRWISFKRVEQQDE